MWKFILFEKACLAKAFSGKFWPIEKLSGGLAVLLLLFAKSIPLPEGVSNMLEDGPLYFFLLVFFLTVFAGYIVAPYSLYKEQLDAKVRLEFSRMPKIEVFIGDPHGTAESTGRTLQASGGNRYTNLEDTTQNALSLVVTNTGETRIDKCTATLRWVECVEGENIGKSELLEPIQLPWSHADTEGSLDASLDPTASRRVWLVDVNDRGWAWIMREANNLPANYQQILGPSGRYRLIIQVTDGSSLSIETKVEISCSKGEPEVNYPYGRGKASIAILEQDSQPLGR
jgi:hypothetical protein